MLKDDDTSHLRRAVEDAVASVAGGSRSLAGWLSLDLAELLALSAREDLAPGLTPEQADRLDRIILELGRLTEDG